MPAFPRSLSCLLWASLLIPLAQAAQFQPFNGSGEPDNAVDLGEDVYVYGTGFEGNQTISVLVVPDDSYTGGEPYQSEAEATVRTNSRGVLFLQKIWTALKAGFFDLIADLNGNGRHDGADVVVRGTGPGLTVTDPSPAREIEEGPEFSAPSIPILAGIGVYLVWRRRP